MLQQDQMMLDQGFITPSEASRRIGIGPVAVVRLVERKQVERQRAGRRWYISVQSLAKAYEDAPLIQEAILKGQPAEPAKKSRRPPRQKPARAAKSGGARRRRRT